MNYQIHDSAYYLQRGFIDAREEDCCVRLIEDAAVMCDATYARQQATARIKSMPGIVVWCPNADPKNLWENKTWELNDIFTERYVGASTESASDIKNTQDENTKRYLDDPLVRITFFKERDTDYYRFLGV